MRSEIDAVRHQVVEGRAAGRLLQPVDAAEAAIVQHHDGQLQAHRHRGRDLGIHHQVAAVADQHDHRARRIGQFDAEAAGDLVAHAGVAVFQMVGAGTLGLPQLVQLARQAAGGANHHRPRRRDPLHRADDLRVGGEGRPIFPLPSWDWVGGGGPAHLVSGVTASSGRPLPPAPSLEGRGRRGGGGVCLIPPIGSPRGDPVAPVGRDPVAVQPLRHRRQARQRIGHQRQRVVLAGIERLHIQPDQPPPEQGARPGRKILQPRADRQHAIRRARRVIGGRGAGHADRTEVQRMVLRQHALARLRLAHGDAVAFGEGTQRVLSLGIQHAAAGHDQRRPSLPQ